MTEQAAEKVVTWSRTPAQAVAMSRRHSEMIVGSYLTCTNPDESYAGSVGHVRIGDTFVSRTRDLALRNERTSRHVAGSGHDGVHIFVNAGVGLIAGEQFGRAYSARAGEGGLYLYNAPNVTHIGHGSSLLGITLPRSVTRMWRQAPEDLVGRGGDKSAAAFQVLKSYLRLLYSGDICDGQVAASIQTHIGELAGLWLGGLKPADLAENDISGRQAARLAAIDDLMRRHLDDPAFSVMDLATALRLSPRTVQYILSQDGESFSRRLANLRVERAAQWLMAPGSLDSAITAIAYDVGFSDLSTFYRSFRRRFGCSPADMRAGVSR